MAGPGRCGLKLCCALLAGAAGATANVPATLEVRRSPAAVDCPDVQVLAARINSRAGGMRVRAADGSASQLSIAVMLDRDLRGYHAEIRTRGTLEGVRHIQDAGESCEALSAATAVSIALLLDEARRQEPVAAEPSVRVGFGGTAGPVFAFGIVAPASPGVRSELELRWQPLLLGGGVIWLPPRRTATDPGDLELSLVAGTFRGCYEARPLDTALGVLLCAEAVIGAIHAQTRDVDGARSAEALWAGLGVGAELGGIISGPLGWGAAGALLGPVADERFTIRGVSEPIHDPPRLGAMLGAWLRLSNF